MLELPRPLLRVLDGPGLIVQKLTAFVSSLDLRSIDPDYILWSMAEADPDTITYLQDQDVVRRRLLEEKASSS
jgi:hypothetical protein